MDAMRRLALILGIAASMLLAGCSSNSKQLVGTWKGDLIPQSPSKNSIESGLKGLLGAIVGPLTLEFNADGKYKASVSMASATGTYSVSGDEVTMVPDDKSNQNNKGKFDFGKLVLSADGKTLHTKKEFESDSVLELKKQE